MNDMKLPSEDELARLSRDLDWRYPDSYLRFIRSENVETLEALNREFPYGWFVRSTADIREFLDAEMTGDELAVFFVKGSRQQMADISPYGAPQGLTFYGFDQRDDLYPDLEELPVVAFHIHAMVVGWNSFPEIIAYIENKTDWRKGKFGHLVAKRQ